MALKFLVSLLNLDSKFPTKNFINAYHGTTEENAKSILASKLMYTTDEDYHWLGDGAYFFQDAPLRAWKFAKEHVCREDSKPAVIKAKLDFSYFLDLLDIEHWDAIEAIYSKCKNQNAFQDQCGPLLVNFDGKTIGITGPAQINRFIGNNTADCHVIKDYTSEYEKLTNNQVNAVRCIFAEGMQLFENSYYFDHNHIQIAVKDPKIIYDFEVMDSELLENKYTGNRRVRWPVTPRP